MASQLTTLRNYFTTRPNPRANNLGAQDAAYNPGDAAITAKILYNTSANLLEPVVHLASATETETPLPLALLWSMDTPGGPHNTGQKYSFCGDVLDNGQFPPVVVMDQTVFDTTQPATVPTHATIQAVWTANDAANSYLEQPQQDTENITTRNIMPIPHQYVSPILQAYQDNTLTWRWLVTHVLAPIQNDPAEAAAYPNFCNYIRAASTLGAPPAPNQPPAPAVMELGYCMLPFSRCPKSLPMPRRSSNNACQGSWHQATSTTT